MFSGLRFFIKFLLPFVRPSQTDQSNCPAPFGVDQNMKTLLDKTDGDKSFFAILSAIVLGFDGRRSIK